MDVGGCEKHHYNKTNNKKQYASVYYILSCIFVQMFSYIVATIMSFQFVFKGGGSKLYVSLCFPI